MAGCPWFSTGQKPCGAWPRKYAIAISPARMKATGRVNSPSRRNTPPNVSRIPAMPGSDAIAAVPPPGMIAAGNANSLAVPNCMKRNAATIRRTLSRYGARVADQGEEVGNQAGLDAELLTHPCRVADLVSFAIDLHHAITPHALRQVLVGRPDADLLHPRVFSGEVCRGRKRVVGLQLDHGPDRHSHGGEGLLQRLELRKQRRLDAFSGLVIGPELVAKRFDHVIGRHADVSGSLLDHLQYRVQHAGDGAERLILTLGEVPPAVELAE